MVKYKQGVVRRLAVGAANSWLLLFCSRSAGMKQRVGLKLQQQTRWDKTVALANLFITGNERLQYAFADTLITPNASVVCPTGLTCCGSGNRHETNLCCTYACPARR